MKLGYLRVDDFKNLRDCEIEFAQSNLLSAVIGGNGSGKSNLVEAILHILIGVYFKKAPPFNFEFRFESHRRQVTLRGEDGRLSSVVDGERVPLNYFAERLRGGPTQVYYPELTFVYYSGECDRVRKLIKRYRSDFQKLTRNPDTDSYRPLFVESTNHQAEVILLALFAHHDRAFLKRLDIKGVTNITLVLHSPEGFDPELHEPKLWGTVGAVRRIVAAIDGTADSEESRRHEAPRTAESSKAIAYTETRTYRFSDDDRKRTRISDLAERLSKSKIGDNLYVALEHLRARGILRSVDYQLSGRDRSDRFEFEHLSEGEKQLIAVVGALRLTNQADNLVLLDEPDTHLNPHWSWDYPGMLTEAFSNEQRSRSSVLMATHDPVMISGLTKDQVLLAHLPSDDVGMFTRPHRNPRGQGIANLLCSSEFFGLPSSLDKETQKLLDERLKISMKEDLTDDDKERLGELNQQLEILTPGVSERDPDYVAFLHKRHAPGED